MVAQETENTDSTTYVFRLLTSLLRGCEFTLQPGKTLFIVGSSTQVVNNTPSLSSDTLYLPTEGEGNNFELIITEEGSITLHELQQSGISKQTIALNKTSQIGEIVFAIREQHANWSPDVINYPFVKTKQKKPALKVRPGKKTIVMTAIMLLAGLSIFAGYQRLSAVPIQANQLANLLDVEQQGFAVLPASNDTLYVLTNTEQETLWAQQALIQAKIDYPVQVVNPQQENDRISYWLNDNYPSLPYYRLDLINPRNPHLWISQQRTKLSEPDASSLLEKLKQQLPYAEKITLTKIDDESVTRQAIEGLTRESLAFTRYDSLDNVTFMIRGTLSDAELQRTRNFIENYYQQWGNRYVRFALELKDSTLKGSSFQAGEQGYFKVTPGHWYFPNLSK